LNAASLPRNVSYETLDLKSYTALQIQKAEYLPSALSTQPRL